MPPKKKAKASSTAGSTPATTRRGAASASSTTPATTRSSTRAATKRNAAAVPTTPEESPPAAPAPASNGKRKRGSAELPIECDGSEDIVVGTPAPTKAPTKPKAKAATKAAPKTAPKAAAKVVPKKAASTKSKASSKFNKHTCEWWFGEIAGHSVDVIGAEQIVGWFNELHISDESIVLYIILWKCKAENSMEITKEEFLKGMQELGIDCNEKLLAKLPAIVSSARPSYDNPLFLDLYKFCFHHFKAQGARYLTLEFAGLVLKSLLDENLYSMDGKPSEPIKDQPESKGSMPGLFPHTYAFLEYLEREKENGKQPVITKDQYEQFIPFNKDVPWSLEGYKEEESTWPSLFDSYIGWKKTEYSSTVANDSE